MTNKKEEKNNCKIWIRTSKPIKVPENDPGILRRIHLVNVKNSK